MAAVEARSKLFLLTLETERSSCHVPASAARHISLIHLQPLPLPWIAPLACQFLHAEAIQPEVLR